MVCAQQVGEYLFIFAFFSAASCCISISFAETKNHVSDLSVGAMLDWVATDGWRAVIQGASVAKMPQPN